MKRALLVGVAILLEPVSALAQGSPAEDSKPSPQAGLDPDAPPPTVHVVDDTEAKSPLIPSAPDWLGKHVLIGAAASPTWALGKLGRNLAATDRLGIGYGARLDAGFGLSRELTLGLWGSVTAYTDGDSCGGRCKGRAFSLGPFVRYHLAQGLRLDPWLSLGAGYRQVSFETGASTRQKFSGVEWLRLELGADYYAFSGFGFGPYGALGLSTYSKRPSVAGDASVSAELSVGLRLLLDLPGR
jgi:hypothetical protein